jgi:hypothetical protein
MVHEDTPLDNWYHEMVNKLTVAANFTRIATCDLKKGESVTEIVIMLEKATKSHEKMLCMLREDYIERKRLEKKDELQDLKDLKIIE